MAAARANRPPLDRQRLEELAVRYVGRYATTQARLRQYLARKIRERGWAESAAPDLDSLTERLARLGYVDDAAYALAKSRALTGRGYGSRRVTEKLRQAGIDADDRAAAQGHAEANAISAALRFAERRRIGPFGSASGDPQARQKAIAAMVRAGHPFALARIIATASPGAQLDSDVLEEAARLVAN